MDKNVICVVGPTASGKTDLAVQLALALDGEVVSCDSMQIYRGMDIGTAKPTREERQGIPHHMLDVADPTESYSVSRFVDEADRAVQDVLARGKRAILAGKHVLCEKPMVLSKAEAEDCFRLADEKGLVLMEGVKTAYCPGYHKVIEKAKSGIIGDIRYIDSCFTKLEGESSRELNDTEYGGSFTELGSYVMLPVFDLLGYIGEPLFVSLCDSKGIDLFTRMDAKGMYGIASAECGLGVKAEGRLLISGTKGFIKAAAPWWKTRHIEIHFEDESKSISLDEPFEGDGLRYEISEFMQQIENGGRVTNYAPKDRSVFMADMMERFLHKRAESGVSSK